MTEEVISKNPICKYCHYYIPKPDLFKNSPVYTGACSWWNGHATHEDGFCYKWAEKLNSTGESND